MRFVLGWLVALTWIFQLFGFALASAQPRPWASSTIAPTFSNVSNQSQKDAFIDDLINRMTVTDLVLQLHLMFGDSIVGPNSDNALYDFTMRFSPGSPIGVMHDWYPQNISQYNGVQQLNLDRAELPIPFMHTGECLHGVGSYNQSIFPQALGMAASFDIDIVHRVGHAIATEARSIGVHACFAPVLDLAQDPRWGRAQEDWGEDKILTSHMGVAFASGLSKNSSWAEPDAVVPVMKHFAAHGSPQAGHNTAPFMGHGNRQVLEEMLIPFKAAVDLGGVRGVMMAYSEFDDVPCAVHPLLYQALSDWGYDGFVIADDTGMNEIETVHMVAGSPADAIQQWFNAGGMIQFYDYPLEVYLNATQDLVANGTVAMSTLQSRVRRILGVKWDLGLFDNPYISNTTDPAAIVDSHASITLEAAEKSIVLLENKNATLPLNMNQQNITNIALIGPFSDVINYGDYSGPWGAYPVHHVTTIRQGILDYLQSENSSSTLTSSWGTNTWLYNGQYAIPPYLLSANGTAGGLQATYFNDINFTAPMLQKLETPTLDWGLYPPPGLSSNNFSVVWEGDLESPVTTDVDGWIGLAIGPNSTATLYVDEDMIYHSDYSMENRVLPNIEQLTYVQANGSKPTPDSSPFTFRKGVSYHIRIEFQSRNTYQKIENESSLNAQILLFWNLVSRTQDPISQATDVANDADVIVLALGAGWNSDGESGDRGTLDLATNQDALAKAIYNLGKPVVLILQGGRPFAIPDYYNKSAAVLNTYFPGQAGGQAIANILFGAFNPGGRVPISVPRYVGQIPIYYNYKPTAHVVKYLDIDSTPCYPFGYGLSYTSFDLSDFQAVSRSANNRTTSSGNQTFSKGDLITFSVKVKNNGTYSGSYVPQIYLLQRVSTIVQPVRQLVAFTRLYLDAGQEETVSMDLEVDRYLLILNRKYEWELEKGDYPFALLAHGGADADTSMNLTMTCI